MTPRTLSARLREMYSGTLAGEESRRRWRGATRTAGSVGRGTAYGLPALRASLYGTGARASGAARGRPARPPASKPEAASAPVVVVVMVGPGGEVVDAQAVAAGGPGGPVPWPEILEALKRPAVSPPGSERPSKETKE